MLFHLVYYKIWQKFQKTFSNNLLFTVAKFLNLPKVFSARPGFRAAENVAKSFARSVGSRRQKTSTARFVDSLPGSWTHRAWPVEFQIEDRRYTADRGPEDRPVRGIAGKPRYAPVHGLLLSSRLTSPLCCRRRPILSPSEMASPAPASLKDTVGSLDRDGFVGLLSKLIGETARRCL